MTTPNEPTPLTADEIAALRNADRPSGWPLLGEERQAANDLIARLLATLDRDLNFDAIRQAALDDEPHTNEGIADSDSFQIGVGVGIAIMEQHVRAALAASEATKGRRL